MLRRGGFPRHRARRLGRRAGLCQAQGRRAARRGAHHRLEGAAAPTPPPTRRCAKLNDAGRRASTTKPRLTARSSCRCGRNRYGTYDDLARVKEWSLAGGVDGDERVSARPRHSRTRCGAGRRRRPIPSAAAFVAANAGSGKTHVLAQRVIRLMLDGGAGGVDPSKILCITFTKAAAANMAARVYDTLRGLDRARRRGARRGDARDRRRPTSMPPSARARGACSRRRWRRPAASRCRPSTPSAPASCSSSRSRPTWRRASPCWRSARRTRCCERATLGVLLEAAGAPDSALGRALKRAVAAAADTTFLEVVREAIEQARKAAALDRRGRRRRARHGATCRRRSASRPTTISRRSRQEIVDGPHLPSSHWAARRRRIRQGLEERSGPGRAAVGSARGIGRRARLDKLSRACSSPATSEPRTKRRHRGARRQASRPCRTPRRRAGACSTADRAPQRRDLPRPHRGARHHRAAR